MFYWAMLLVVAGNVLYHLAQKSIPRTLDPFFSVTVTYVAALLISLALLPFASARPLRESARQLNWASVGVGVAAVVIEFAFLFVYRTGWNVSQASMSASAAIAAILAPIGILVYRERLSLLNVLGLLLCVAGLILAGVGRGRT